MPSTQSCKMSKGLWFRTLTMSCREGPFYQVDLEHCVSCVGPLRGKNTELNSANLNDCVFLPPQMPPLPSTELDSKAQNLSMMSAKYKKDAASLNATSWVAIGAGVSVLFIVFFLWYKFLF